MNCRRNTLIPLFCMVTGLVHGQASNTLDQSIESRLVAQQEAQQSQERIDNLSDETRSLLDRYRQAIRRTDSLKAYNTQLRNSIENQKTQLESITRQLANIDETRRSITPLLVRMVDVLEQTISVDMPFLMNERNTRLASIREMMGQTDVPIPEKYRRIMEAYQIEIEYGRTIESYTDEISIDGTEQTVNVLRIGRIILAYQTLDESSSGIWDMASKSWQTIPDDYTHSIKQGITIARNQSPPDLFILPVKMPGGAQ